MLSLLSVLFEEDVFLCTSKINFPSTDLLLMVLESLLLEVCLEDAEEFEEEDDDEDEDDDDELRKPTDFEERLFSSSCFVVLRRLILSLCTMILFSLLNAVSFTVGSLVDGVTSISPDDSCVFSFSDDDSRGKVRSVLSLVSLVT